MKATLNNTFHNTSKKVRFEIGKNIISARRLKTWKKALCCGDCCCSGNDGIRGNETTRGLELSVGYAMEYYSENGQGEMELDISEVSLDQLNVSDNPKNYGGVLLSDDGQGNQLWSFGNHGMANRVEFIQDGIDMSVWNDAIEGWNYKRSMALK